jgi:hypothetical protein
MGTAQACDAEFGFVLETGLFGGLLGDVAGHAQFADIP